jgi:hypothetical protein
MIDQYIGHLSQSLRLARQGDVEHRAELCPAVSVRRRACLEFGTQRRQGNIEHRAELATRQGDLLFAGRDVGR